MFKLNTPYRKDSRVALLTRKKTPRIYRYGILVYHIQGISGTPQYESTYHFRDLRDARKFLSVIATPQIYNSTGFFTRLLKEI